MKRVCMVVPNRMVKGGIAAVVNGYRGSQLEKDYEITYVGVDWFKEHYSSQAFFANTLDEAKCLADKILSGYDYKRNDNYFEQEYYGKLRRKIEQELRI